MADQRQIPAQCQIKVQAFALAMVEVELQTYCRCSYRIDNVCHLFGQIIKVPGHVCAVQCFQQQGHALLACHGRGLAQIVDQRSEEHTSELQSLMRISYAVFCLKKKNNKKLITPSTL